MSIETQATLSAIHIFLISWQGQHENALKICRELSKLEIKVTIIYSDPKDINFPCETYDAIQRPNDLFWGDKFKTCLDSCTTDHMLVIHADCECSDWPSLVLNYAKAIKKINNLGVWGPKVSGTKWTTDITSVLKFKDKPHEIVSFIDGIVFGISKVIQKRMRQAVYTSNIYGWGIGWLIASHSYVTNQLLIVDNSTTVEHIKGRGYNSSAAAAQEIEFRKQFSIQELIMYKTIRGYIHSKELQLASKL